MKKALSLILVLILSLSLFSCSRTPEDRLPKEVKRYVSENYRINRGDSYSQPVDVEISSITDAEENEWIVVGTYTVKIDSEVVSAAFGMVAKYNESNRKFTFSNEYFDEFR